MSIKGLTVDNAHNCKHQAVGSNGLPPELKDKIISRHRYEKSDNRFPFAPTILDMDQARWPDPCPELHVWDMVLRTITPDTQPRQTTLA